MTRGKRLAVLAAFGAVVLIASELPARADEPSASTGASTFTLGPAFRYTTPPSRDYLRAVAEQLIVLGIGFFQYSTNKANEEDWDLAPSWASIESKLTLSSLTFDNNRFDTNWLTHPFAGFLYYSTARSNRLSLPVSLAYATASATLWEYFGELREHAAINDLIATPMTGVPLGESMLQLGALVHRARRTAASSTLGWLFAPFKSAHDLLDGIDPEPATWTDELGLPTDVWHRISVGGGAGVTSQARGVTQGDGRFFAQSRIVSVPQYGLAGTHRGWFDDGEVTEIAVRTSVSDGRMVDFGVAAHTLAFGYAAQEVVASGAGELHGHGFFAGLHVGTEYALHDYDRDGLRPRDRIALVDTGLTFEERVHAGPLLVRVRVDGLVNFAGVSAYALSEHRRAAGDAGLPSVLRNQGYYHAYGATLTPRIDAELGPVDARADLRADWFDSINYRDVEPSPDDDSVDASDRRVVARASFGYSPWKHMRLSLTGERAAREGRVGAAHAKRSELGLHGAAEVVF